MWDTFDLAVAYVVLGVIYCIHFKLDMMEHLCNASITIATADVKQRVKVHRHLVFFRHSTLLISEFTLRSPLTTTEI